MWRVLFVLVCGIIWRTTGQLYTDDVSDGKCTNVPPAANFTACLPLVNILPTLCFHCAIKFKKLYSQVLVPHVYSVQLGSDALFRNYAESFLGRPAQNQSELDEMCFSFAFVEALAVQSGYGTKTNIRTAIPTQLNLLQLNLGDPFGLGSFLITTTLAQTSGSTTQNQCMNLELCRLLKRVGNLFHVICYRFYSGYGCMV